MPAKSGKQYRFMQMIAHSKHKLKGIGLSREQAEEFIHATPKKFSKKLSKK